MAFPTSHRPAATPACQTSGPGSTTTRAYAEGGHQLEKLEFALAVAMTRGDAQRIEQLRAQIAELGGNREEPGT
jgi:hypothetical protein